MVIRKCCLMKGLDKKFMHGTSRSFLREMGDFKKSMGQPGYSAVEILEMMMTSLRNQ